MGTNYTQRLRDQGRYDPAKWRREREAKQLENLECAWSEACEPVKAAFMAWAGLREVDPDASPAPSPLTAEEQAALAGDLADVADPGEALRDG